MQAGKNNQGVPLQPGNCALLSASLATGVVMRSYPFSGKVVRGHFDASSTTTALGLGVNPNFQEAFSNVSALALTSTGGTGLVIWGLRSGSVAVTVAPRAMEVGCSARMIKCTLPDAHGARVDSIQVDQGANGPEYFATGATDGSVKLWALPTNQRGQVNCVWTGGYTDPGHLDSDVASFVAVPCLKMATSVSNEIVSAGFADGTVLVWFGVIPGLALADPTSVKCIRIPPPSLQASSPATLHLHTHSRNIVSILVHHFGDDHFYRLRVDKDTGLVKRTRFGAGPLADLTAIVTEFTKQEKEDARSALGSTVPSGVATPAFSVPPTPRSDRPSPANGPLHLTLPTPEAGSAPKIRSFVIAGDALGRVCLWDWDGVEEVIPKEIAGTRESDEAKKGKSEMLEVRASIFWDAADGEGISTITWSDVVIVVGTTYGDALIFDSLTQRLLKRIPAPSPASAHHSHEGVSQIIVDGDVLLVGVGGQVTAWQARKESGKAVNGWGKATKSKKSKTGGTTAKWQQISHSLNQLKDENARSQPSLRRARAQAGALAELGMDESEAVQYLMMLSRDEEDARAAAQAENSNAEETGRPVEAGSPTNSNPNTYYGSPTGSTRSTVPSTSTSPSSRRSGPSIYIPANRRPRSSVEDTPDLSPYTSRSPYGSYQSGRSHRSGAGSSLDEDEELRMVLELSLLEQ
ncbi:F-box and WD repeat protein [Ceratobasidium sp. AG-Ba]|nr:F-box and WD repeat protein [Ceratobasidium sp. AG-Ba]